MRTKLFFLLTVLTAAGMGAFGAYTHIAIQKAPRYFFRMRPVDPRALLMGDYMRLSYEIANGTDTDTLRVYVGENNVVTREKTEGAAFFDIPVKIKSGGKDRERRTLRAGGWRSPATLRLPYQFYFEEGQGEKYNKAQYVQLARTPDGRFFVTALADENLQIL
jgi:uncharacterized membrane-anchored protein